MNALIKPSERHHLAEMFKAVSVAFDGRYLINTREELLCRAIEMSPVEVTLHALVKPDLHTKVVLYLKELGRFEGSVTRQTPMGFAMALSLSERKRERLAAQLIWYENRAAHSLEDRRKHQRIVPLRKLIVVRHPNGEERLAKIASISCSGVALITRFAIMPGNEVIVGRKSATVVRLTEDGFACEFAVPFKEDELDENAIV